MGKKGFTLIEIVVVVIIIGILAAIAIPNYLRTVEKGRSSEARKIMGQIREAQFAYFLSHDAYAATVDELGLGLTDSACTPDYYFSYTFSMVGAIYDDGFTVRAERCMAGGKPPTPPEYYFLELTHDGILTANPTYYQ